MAHNRKSWPAPTPGDVRVIGPNGTTRSYGDQSPFSNGFMGKGNLGTTRTSEELLQGNCDCNRTGEGRGSGY